MTDSTMLIASLVAFAAGAVLSGLCARKRLLAGWVAFISAVIGSTLAGYVGWTALTQGPVHSNGALMVLPFFNQALNLEVNAISGVFLLITALVAVLVTLYSIRYMERYERYSTARYYPVLMIFFGSIVALLSVHNLLYFAIFWEVMTLAGWALMAFDSRDEQASEGSLIYIIANHAATGLMVLAIVILYVFTPTASFTFEAFRETMAAQLVANPWVVHVAVGLFVIAAATKSGILPFGFWLPHAYPKTPSPFAAAASGVMEKMGVYRLLLVFTVLFPVTPALSVWGMLMVLLAAGSIVVGTFTALRQTEGMRLLAFSTIGQMGYIWLGVGIGVTLLPIHQPLAALALIAGLFHAVNHAAFKSLLFFNAGAAQYRTGTSALDRAGGLMQIMPYTTGAAIIASLAIGAVPGLNGFASKWLIAQSALLGAVTVPVLVLFGLISIFVAAVTLAYILKFTGILFLGELDIDETVEKRDVPAEMLIAQYVPAALCVLFGIAPMLVITHLHGAVSTVISDPVPLAQLFGVDGAVMSLASVQGGIAGAWGPGVVVAAFAGCLLLAWGLSRIGRAGIRQVPVWLCGEEHTMQECKYPVRSFLLTFNRLFEWMYPSIPMPDLVVPVGLMKVFGVDAPEGAEEHGGPGGGGHEWLPRLARTPVGEFLVRHIGHRE